jgi:hypothetical protein
MRNVRTQQPRGQKWSTDLAHARRRHLGLRRACRSAICSFDLCWLLGTSVLKIGILSTIEPSSLPKNGRNEYNQRGPFCSYSLTTCLSSRRGSISAFCIQLNQATSMFQLSCSPRTCFALDKATNTFTFARNIRRDDQRKIRPACRERPVTTPTGHPSSTNQTSGLQEKRSASPGARCARMVRTWKQALFLVQEDDGSREGRVSSSVCSASANQRRMRESRGFRPRRFL